MPLVTQSGTPCSWPGDGGGFGGSGQERAPASSLIACWHMQYGFAGGSAWYPARLRQYPLADRLVCTGAWLAGDGHLAPIARHAAAATVRDAGTRSIPCPAGALIAATDAGSTRGRTHLQYPSRPMACCPGFTPWVGVAMLFLALPALVSLAALPHHHAEPRGVPQ